MEAMSSTRELSATINDRKSLSEFQSWPIVAVAGRDCVRFIRPSRDGFTIDCPPFNAATVRGVKFRRKGGRLAVPLTGPPSELIAETDLPVEPLIRSVRLSNIQIAATNGACVILSKRILVLLMTSGARKILNGRSASGIRF